MSLELSFREIHLEVFVRAIFLFILTFGSAFAFAGTGTFDSKNAQALADGLGDYQMTCNLQNRNQVSDFEGKFFPLTLTSKKVGSGKVELTLASADGQDVGFGGSEMGSPELTNEYTIISVGDDGYNVFFLPNPAIYDGAVRDFLCEDGNGASGILSQSWSYDDQRLWPLVCCFEKK